MTCVANWSLCLGLCRGVSLSATASSWSYSVGCCGFELRFTVAKSKCVCQPKLILGATTITAPYSLGPVLIRHGYQVYSSTYELGGYWRVDIKVGVRWLRQTRRRQVSFDLNFVLQWLWLTGLESVWWVFGRLTTDVCWTTFRDQSTGLMKFVAQIRVVALVGEG